MKYRILTLVGLLALSAGSFLQAQDYDDIYYDGSKSTTGTKKTKVETPVKTVAVYGEVPDTYKVAAQSNYRVERDEDEYNRRGVYDPEYALDLNGDTIYSDSIYEEAFANTHLIERFYNPDIVILSSDDELIELYYDESPTINLVVGSDWGYGSYYGWASSYYPWYTGWYDPWYTGWYDPWYTWYSWRPWHSPFYYSWYRPYGYWGWTYSPWYWGHNHWYWGSGYRPGWNDWAWHGNNSHTGHARPARPNYDSNWISNGHRTGLATNRNGRTRVDAMGSNRNGISARSTGGNRTGLGSSNGRSGTRGGYATSRGSGNMGSRSSSGVSPRNSSGYSGSRSSSSGRSGSYSSSGRSGSSYSGGRSSGSYSSGGSRSGGSYGGSSGSYSSGSSGGGRSSGGGGGHGGSSGGGGHRR